MNDYEIIVGDCMESLKTMPEKSVHCCVTSPPYFGLRCYGGGDAEFGKEETPDAFVGNLVELFRGVRRVLRDDGTVWLNLGDSYVGATSQHKEGGSAGKNSPISKKTLSGLPTEGRGNRNRALYDSGLKMKQLIGIPWRVAFALQADGWYLRQDIIWSKPNPMPESVRDRCTKAHEYIFLLSKKPKYYFDSEAMKEPASAPPKRCEKKNDASRNDHASTGHVQGDSLTRNRRSVWNVATKPYRGAHFATFPPELIRPCILAGCPEGGTVLDPFGGSGTTGQVAIEENRSAIMLELNPEYAKLAHDRVGAAWRKKILSEEL